MTTTNFIIKQHLSFVINSFLSFVDGGENCIICGKYSFLIPICSDCRSSRLKIDFDLKRCSVCGKILVSEKEKCMECRNDALSRKTDAIFPIFPYRLWNSELLRMWKLGDERVLSAYFAKFYAEALKVLQEKYGDFAIVPVPPRPGKIKSKGWDQIQEISEFLEYEYGFCVMRVLERNTVIEQKKLGREERFESAEKSYSLMQNAPILPKLVCLLDDVITTGATIESCAEALKDAGAEKVFAIALFSVGG